MSDEADDKITIERKVLIAVVGSVVAGVILVIFSLVVNQTRINTQRIYKMEHHIQNLERNDYGNIIDDP